MPKSKNPDWPHELIISERIVAVLQRRLAASVAREVRLIEENKKLENKLAVVLAENEAHKERTVAG